MKNSDLELILLIPVHQIWSVSEPRVLFGKSLNFLQQVLKNPWCKVLVLVLLCAPFPSRAAWRRYWQRSTPGQRRRRCCPARSRSLNSCRSSRLQVRRRTYEAGSGGLEGGLESELKGFLVKLWFHLISHGVQSVWKVTSVKKSFVDVDSPLADGLVHLYSSHRSIRS